MLVGLLALFFVQPLCCSGNCVRATGLFCFCPQFFNKHVEKVSRHVSRLQECFQEPIGQDIWAVLVSHIVKEIVEAAMNAPGQ